MSNAPSQESAKDQLRLGLVLLSLLWIQLCYVLTPSWGTGSYYDYGWLVPPVVFFLAFLRWQDPIKEQKPPAKIGWMLVIVVLALLLLVPIRIIEQVDPRWRLTLWLHAGLALGITHIVVALLKGWRRSFYLMPATLLILVSIPLPGIIEQRLVDGLTDLVLNLSEGSLPIVGYPAIRTGSSFLVDGKMLDVAEGCSGIRSFQSCITAALALGELRRFKIPKRLFFLIVGVLIAVAANVVRVIVLTRIAFVDGHDAMDKAHDNVGLTAAVVTYILIGILAWLLGAHGTGKKRVVKHRK